MFCPKCHNAHSFKNGYHHGKQRYKCKSCGFQYTQTRPRGKPIETKCLAVLLYVNGLSFRAIGKIVNVSHKTVYEWVKAFGLQTYEKPQPTGEIIVELDEMWHYLTHKKTSSGFGKHIVVLQVNSLTGNVEGVTVKLLE